MKRMCLTTIMVFMFWTMMFSQNKRLMTGINAYALAEGEASVFIEHGLSERWSAGGEITYGFGRLIKGIGDIEKAHKEEFGNDVSAAQPEDLYRECIYARYWAKEVAKGPYLIAGICHGNTSGTDFNIGIGILMNIWKSINIYTEYRRSLTISEVSGNGLSVGISLTFDTHKK